MLPKSETESFLPPRWILTLLAFTFFIWFLFALREMVVLLVVGYSIAYLIDPVLDWLEERKIPRPLGLGVLLTLLFGMATLFVMTIVPVIMAEAQWFLINLPSYSETLRAKAQILIETWQTRFPALSRYGTQVPSTDQILPQFNSETISPILSGVGGALLQGYSITLTIVNLLLLPFIVFYLALDIDRYHETALQLFPRKYRETVDQLAREIDRHISAFVRGQLLVGFILFVLYSIGLGFVAKVDLWFLLACISGFGNLVPYLGTLTGFLLSSLMAIVGYHDVSALVWVAGVYGVVQLLEGTFITPKVIGDKIGLSPLTVILAIVAFGKIFGLLGIFLAIPMAGVFRVLGKYLHRWVLRQV